MARPLRYRLNLLLRLVQLTGDIGAVARLHAPIQREIATSCKRIDKAKATENDEYLDAVVDDECDRIEELLGIAFVAAQTFIARLRGRLVWVSDILKEEFGTGLSFAAQPWRIYKRGRTLPSGPAVIEAINAVANYWKHQEDWPKTEAAKGGRVITIWNVQLRSLRKNERHTIEVVKSLGMTPDCTGNLRTAAEVLSVADYADLSPIQRELQVWADDLVAATRLEISQLQASHP